jgi:hypothetical protein
MTKHSSDHPVHAMSPQPSSSQSSTTATTASSLETIGPVMVPYPVIWKGFLGKKPGAAKVIEVTFIKDFMKQCLSVINFIWF